MHVPSFANSVDNDLAAINESYLTNMVTVPVTLRSLTVMALVAVSRKYER